MLLYNALCFVAVVGEFTGARSFTGAQTSGRALTLMYCARERLLAMAFYVSAMFIFEIFYVCVTEMVPFFKVTVMPFKIVVVGKMGARGIDLKFFLALTSSCRKVFVPMPSESPTCNSSMPSRTPLVRLIKTHGCSLTRFILRTSG